LFCSGGGGGGVWTWIWAEAGDTKTKRKISAVTRIEERFLVSLEMTDFKARSKSVRRSVVAGLGVDGQGREALGRTEFDLDLAPAGVVSVIAWSVSEYILVAQLHADLGRDVREIIKMLNGEDATARQFGQLSEKRGTVEFFRRTIAITKRVVNADGVELGVRFLNEALDIVLVVPTMIIASIGENEQGTFGVMCTPHLAQTKVDSVQKGSPALRGSHHHSGLQIFDRVGEGTSKLGALVEAHQEKLVLGVGGLKELEGSFAGLVDLVGHATAEVEDDADGNGHVFRREADHLLLDVVLKDAKIVGFEPGNETIIWVRYRDIDER